MIPYQYIVQIEIVPITFSFQILLGVVSTLATLVLADSDAKSDPGQTHYVNAGFNQGFKLGHPANLYASDVNQVKKPININLPF